MCDVTFPPKSWENCYVTVQGYRRRFTDPYNIGVWDADYATRRYKIVGVKMLFRYLLLIPSV